MRLSELSPSPNPPLIPPLLPLLPQIIQYFRLPIPLHPLRGLPLCDDLVPLQEALLHRLTYLRLLLQALAQLLVERRGGKGRNRVVHVGLLLAPLALEGVRGEELGLGGGALVGEAGFLFEEGGGEVGVGGEGVGEVGVGGGEGGVDGGRGVGEGGEEAG